MNEAEDSWILETLRRPGQWESWYHHIVVQYTARGRNTGEYEVLKTLPLTACIELWKDHCNSLRIAEPPIESTRIRNTVTQEIIPVAAL